MKLCIFFTLSNSRYIPDLFYIYVAIGVILLIGVGIYFWHKRKKEQLLQTIAIRAGFSLASKQEKLLLEKHLFESRGFYLFDKGSLESLCRVYNVLKGDEDNISWLIFDYEYIVGKMYYTNWQTVAYGDLGEVNIPKFSLGPKSFFQRMSNLLEQFAKNFANYGALRLIIRPKSFFHRLGNSLGLREIDFRDYSGFSSKYVVKGSDEQAIRRLFDYKLLTFFEEELRVGGKKNRPNIEADSNKIIIYYYHKKIKPGDLTSFIEQAREIVHSLLEAKARLG